MTAPVHIFTVDVEDWYQGLDLDMDEWARFAPRLETGLGRLLDLLADAGARATFFVVAPRRTRSTSRPPRPAARGATGRGRNRGRAG